MTPAQPFVKWAGGKRSLLSLLLANIPSVARYHEPFVGGGAVYWALRSRGDAATTFLSDTNSELITTYQVVRDHVTELNGLLAYLQDTHNKYSSKEFQGSRSFYYFVRDQLEPSSQVETAARFLYLNKAGFNGLFRVNRSGKFNVPQGRSVAPPAIHTPRRLEACSRALQGVNLEHGSFEEVVDVEPGDWVYCDPPYDGSSFEYQHPPFTRESQVLLLRAAEYWRSEGATVLVSNADTEAMRELYRGHDVQTVSAPRSINSDGTGRGHVTELLVTLRG